MFGKTFKEKQLGKKGKDYDDVVPDLEQALHDAHRMIADLKKDLAAMGRELDAAKAILEKKCE